MECSWHHAGLEQSRYLEKIAFYFLTFPQWALFLVLFSSFFSPWFVFFCLLLIFSFFNFFLIGGAFIIRNTVNF